MKFKINKYPSLDSIRFLIAPGNTTKGLNINMYTTNTTTRDIVTLNDREKILYKSNDDYTSPLVNLETVVVFNESQQRDEVELI